MIAPLSGFSNLILSGTPAQSSVAGMDFRNGLVVTVLPDSLPLDTLKAEGFHWRS